MTLAQVTRIIQKYTSLGIANPVLFLLLLDLDDVDTKALLVRGVNLAQKPEGSRLVVDLWHDLAPRFGCQHVSEVVVDADRLDPHHAGRVTGLEL